MHSTVTISTEASLNYGTTGATDDAPYLSVVIPAYNEAGRIRATLIRVREYLVSRDYTSEVVVVDDGSNDNTASIAEEELRSFPSVVLRYTPNHGKGYAVRYGMLRARGRYILFSDADLATPIEEVEKLFTAVRDGAEIAIGSRDVPGAKLVRRQSIIREFGGKLFNRCVQVFAVPGIHDTQCGFKLFTSDAARRVFGLCTIDNFSFDVEVLFVARRLGYRIAEVPVTWRHQEGSKVRLWRDGPRMLRTLIRIRTTRYVFGDVVRSKPSTP
jgi:dolichyl-phosphate beta-glucosyltransferase